MKRSKHALLTIDQSGFAPIVVSIVIITVLSLIVLGFSQLVRSNQYNALNKQLNNAAYYAALSGVNDAVAAIHNGFDQVKSSCNSNVSQKYSSFFSDPNLNNNKSVKYTCLLINPEPSNLLYSNIDTNATTAFIATGVNGSSGQLVDPKYITISWQPSESSGLKAPFYFTDANFRCINQNYCLPPASNWHDSAGHALVGALRVSITPLNSTGNGQSLDIPNSANNTLNALLYPVTKNPSTINSIVLDSTTTGINSGLIYPIGCSNNLNGLYACTVKIKDQYRTSSFIISLRSVYAPSEVNILFEDNNQSSLNIKNAQTLIDSTGSDNGVLRRIQVRVSDRNNNGIPSYSIESRANVCKTYYVYPTNQSTKNQGQFSTNNAANCPIN